MALFNKGFFKLHSGAISNLKIDCDVLTDEDYEALAFLIAKHFKFGDVYGIPDGGAKLAAALKPYITSDSLYCLLVDDVLTTGKSMQKWRKEIERDARFVVLGVVIFARSKCPGWITPIFQLSKKFRKD